MIDLRGCDIKFRGKTTNKLKNQSGLGNRVIYVGEFVSNLLQSLAIGLEGGHGTEREIDKLLFKCSSPGSLVVVEDVLHSGMQ